MNNKEIPQKIHYCWFGGNPLPSSAKRCIRSWEKYFPDYEIIRWDESNFNVNIIPYTQEAYKAKKYAFVSDYARFFILYHNGGIYFDTDVEIIRSFNDIIKEGPFMGVELPYKDSDNVYDLGLNPGLGIGTQSYNVIFKEILEYYSKLKFFDSTGKLNLKTVGEHVTSILEKHGMKNLEDIQDIEGIKIYPTDFFCPKSPLDGKLRITNNTRSIHHFDSSWMTKSRKIKIRMSTKYPTLMRILLSIKHFF